MAISIVVLGAGAVSIIALMTFLGMGDYCIVYLFEGNCFFTLKDFLLLVPIIYLGGKAIQWFELFNPLKI